MSNYAIIDGTIVTNVIVWDGNTNNWAPPDGQYAIEVMEGTPVAIGYSYVDGGFQPPFEPAPVIDFEKQKSDYMVTVRDIREKILNRLAGIGVTAIVQEDTATAAAVVEARLALLDLPGGADVLAATDIDSLKAAVLVAYRAAASSAPQSVRSAFADVDA